MCEKMAGYVRVGCASHTPVYDYHALEDFKLWSESIFTRRLIERQIRFGPRLALSRLDGCGPQQAFLARFPDMFSLKPLKLKIEVRLPDQLPLPLYIVLFVVDGLFIESLVIIVIVGVLIVIVVGHDLVGLLSGRTLSEIAVRSQRSLPCRCYDHSIYEVKCLGRRHS